MEYPGKPPLFPNGFPFQDIEKDRMVEIMRSLSAVYFTEILGLCIMENHFHILVRMIPDHYFSDAQIKERFLLGIGDE